MSRLSILKAVKKVKRSIESQIQNIETPHRGKYIITDAGRKALASGEKIDLEYLEKSDEFKAFHSVTTEGIADEPSVEKEESPMEVLASAYQKVNAALASQLMDEAQSGDGSKPLKKSQF